MSNNQFLIRKNLLDLFTEKPTLNNITNTRLIFEYLKKYHGLMFSENFIESLPSFESITRQRRKLAERYGIFRPTDKKVIEARKNQTENILEECRKTWPYE